MLSSELLRRTKEALRTRPRTVTYEKIETDTGLNRSWVEQFGRDKFDDPGVCKVETLYRYLTGSEIQFGAS